MREELSVVECASIGILPPSVSTVNTISVPVNTTSPACVCESQMGLILGWAGWGVGAGQI